MIALRKFLFCSLAAVCAASGALASFDFAALEAELAGPIRIETRQNRTFTGIPSSVTPERIAIRSRVDAGEVEVSFERADIRSLRLPGSGVLLVAVELIETGQTTDGLRLLRAFTNRRTPFLPYLSPAEGLELVEVAEHLLAAGDPLMAVSLGRQLEARLTGTEVARRLHAIRLKGLLNLDFAEDAREEARSWVAAEPFFVTSALGHYALARLALAENETERALDHLLEALVFAQPGAAEINRARALALELAAEIGDTATLEGLRRDLSGASPSP
ncbi:MAG: hypothetical protein JJT96_00300 [Opitutales bacterium]|nr:hypothetical protein [Opitutales bacterium]